MDAIIEVINQIAVLKNKTEYHKWDLAEAVHTAYLEFPAYERGLTSGLCEKLNYTTTQIYNLKQAQELKSITRFIDSLTVSHYARLYRLKEEFDLELAEVEDYLLLAEEENWSVSKMAQEVNNNHGDHNHREEKIFQRLIKTLKQYLETEHIRKFSKETRAVIHDLLEELCQE
jgi:hypothetical protein